MIACWNQLSKLVDTQTHALYYTVVCNSIRCAIIFVANVIQSGLRAGERARAHHALNMRSEKKGEKESEEKKGKQEKAWLYRLGVRLN